MKVLDLDCVEKADYRQEYLPPSAEIVAMRGYCLLDSLSLESAFEDYEDEGELL